jgi:hypothetical protein
MQPLPEYQPKQHSPLFSSCDSLQALLFSENALFQQELRDADCSLKMKRLVSHSKKLQISSVNMSVLNGHIPLTKNSDLMFGVSAFGSDWLTMDGMS